MNRLPAISQYEIFKNRKRILNNPLPFHNENFNTLGDTIKVKVGWGKSAILTRNPKLIRHILQKQNKKYHKSPLQTIDLAKYIGHGLLTSNGDHWRTHRRMVQPAFHKKKLEGLLGNMLEAIRNELVRIEPDTEQNIVPLMGDLAFQVVAKTLFSRGDIGREMEQLQKITEINQKMLIREMRQPYLKWWFKLNGKIKRHLDLSKKGRQLLNKIIEDRIVSDKENDDLLDMLLKARYEDGSPMSRRQLIDEVMILFTAGHETTANALGFTLYFLATNDREQQKIFEEVSHFDGGNKDIMENLGRLAHTKKCIEEAMRLYPPAYVIDRISIENDNFENVSIPKDTLILMSIYELHRYGAFWEAAETFIPERFNSENKKNIQEYYYPFGAGPRMCVGNNFAMYEMILTVAEIIKKYTLQTPLKRVDINPLISLKSRAVPILFTKR